MSKDKADMITDSVSEPHQDPFLTMLDDAIKRRAYGEFIPLPLFEVVLKMINTLPNTKINHEHYPDTYSVAAALEELRRLRPFKCEATPLSGKQIKNIEFCRCEDQDSSQDCGCAFGQCAKGLIY